jgi:hypothetical protein
MPEDRRRFDREILNEIKKVHEIVQEIQIDRAILKTKVEQLRDDLKEADAHTRICSLEQSRKVWKAVVVAIPAFGGLLLGILRYMKMV